MEPWTGVPFPDMAGAEADASRRLSDAVFEVEASHPNVTFEQLALPGSPAEVLITQAASTDALVVGTTGHRGLDAWRLGSVAHAVARRATCPVIVVPPDQADVRHGRIVVGIDGSPTSTSALAWACDEADDRDAELVVAHVWDYAYATELGSPTARDLTEVDAALQLEAAVRIASARRAGPVVALLLEGSTASELADQARRADLVVVGTRGRNPVRAAVFGSVSQAIAAHASCPTVVVRNPHDDR